ncbi:hypothetical protein [Sphingomonas sp.]|uniref:hypothetical protein n=1 Tax=Sphingomonas sp. TaxID=28214 RepID=UPI003BADBD9A
MGQGTPPPDHNDPEQISLIRECTDKIISLEKQRASINADISAERKRIKASNIDMDAWRAAKRRREMDPDVRAEFDRSQTLCNKALGVPVQADLFANDSEAAPGEIPDAA